MASTGQKIKLSALLKITSTVSAHDLAIGEGAVDTTVGFTDVPQPIRDSKIVENNSEAKCACILNYRTLPLGQINFQITGWRST